MTKDLIDLGYENLLEFVIVFLNSISSSASEFTMVSSRSYHIKDRPHHIYNTFVPLILGL